MYNLTESDELKAIVDCELIQVCIGANEFILKFSKNICLTIEGEAQYCSRGKCNLIQTQLYEVVALLGKSISGYQIQDSNILIIDFSDQSSIKLFGSNQDYESFQITSPNFSLIV